MINCVDITPEYRTHSGRRWFSIGSMCGGDRQGTPPQGTLFDHERLEEDQSSLRSLQTLRVTEAERVALSGLAARRNTAQALALQARVVLACAAEAQNKEVAVRLALDAATVSKWRRRFAEYRLDGLRDEPRSGTPRTVDDARIEAVIVGTPESLPANGTHWSSRGMAKT